MSRHAETFFRLYFVTMGRNPKTGWTKRNFRFRDDLSERVEEIIPYEGAGDFTAFLNLAVERLVEQAELERAATRKKKS